MVFKMNNLDLLSCFLWVTSILLVVSCKDALVRLFWRKEK